MSKENGNLTVFGQETEFDGVLEFTDSLVITGKFHGTIKATGDLEIDRSAVCDVDVMNAESIVVSGKVTGRIEASERVELCSGSRVKGDIKTARIRISDNVEFEGQVSMLSEVPDIDIFSVASAEYKDALIKKTDEAR
ncbi:polymer-forming cytoskeletal protein [Treponema peruense]|uniref:Polymer-forming cytoskeletal protein n=1 Tax=Treponema peruense TaxID=2787628 RepID=A0A7T3RF51_9SPIR|nr:polymer-forming cytoskeletal protein [Treponema peruense]QQA01956.1 polymer-forming cytoskeletal protein [Treponema peruense]